MPVQSKTESRDDPRIAENPCRLTLASALAQRERASASTGSRILVGAFELEVVDIGPFNDEYGNVVTFLAHPTLRAAPCIGNILKTARGTCRVVG